MKSRGHSSPEIRQYAIARSLAGEFRPRQPQPLGQPPQYQQTLLEGLHKGGSILLVVPFACYLTAAKDGETKRFMPIAQLWVTKWLILLEGSGIRLPRFESPSAMLPSIAARCATPQEPHRGNQSNVRSQDGSLRRACIPVGRTDH
jgi:hypothetical protein